MLHTRVITQTETKPGFIRHWVLTPLVTSTEIMTFCNTRWMLTISLNQMRRLGWLEGDVMATWESKDDEEEVEVEEIHQAQLKYSLEPEHPIQTHIDCEEGGDSDGVKDAAALVTPADCDGAEANLRQRPFIVQLPGLAGTPQARMKPAHARYGEMMNKNQDSPNIYAPVSSCLKWDIARWAKVRGPSSTSFTELVSIPGVCSLVACVA